jgi:histone H1/5
MLESILKRTLEELIKAIQKILKKKDIEKNCKKAAELISRAIRELLGKKPDPTKAKALLSKAENMCEENIEELLKAKGFIKTFENAQERAAKVSVRARKVAAKKRAVAKRAAVKRKASAKRKVSAKKKASTKKAAAKRKATAKRKS